MGHIYYDDFHQRIFGKEPMELEQKITHTRLAQASGFPPTQLWPELVLECARHYDSRIRIIVGPQGKVMENLTEESIAKVFNIASHHKLIEEINVRDFTKFYEEDSNRALQIMNNAWILKRKPHYSKLPKQLHMSDFKQEYNDIISLLGRVMGVEEVHIFQPWMFHPITQIVSNKHYHWVRTINNNIDAQLRSVQETNKLTMTSYLVYMLAQKNKYTSLSCKGALGQDRLWDVYA